MNTLNKLGCGCNTSQLYNPFKPMTVNSKVIDFDTNLPIENVNIVLRSNDKKGVSTNTKGQFSIDVLPDEILVFSHVSYGTLEIKAKDVLPIEYMNEKVNMLDEVIVSAKKNKGWFIGGVIAFGTIIWGLTRSDKVVKTAV